MLVQARCFLNESEVIAVVDWARVAQYNNVMRPNADGAALIENLD